MARRFLTAEDVRRAQSGEIVVDTNTVVTPHALEAASAAGVTIRTAEGGAWSEPAPDRGPDAEGGIHNPPHLPEPANEGAGTSAVVTAVGHNRPGVLSEITGAVAEFGGNIHDVSQKVVAGLFSIVIVVEFDGGAAGKTFHDLKSRMECMGSPEDYAVTVMHERVFRFMHRV